MDGDRESFSGSMVNDVLLSVLWHSVVELALLRTMIILDPVVRVLTHASGSLLTLSSRSDIGDVTRSIHQRNIMKFKLFWSFVNKTFNYILKL